MLIKVEKGFNTQGLNLNLKKVGKGREIPQVIVKEVDFEEVRTIPKSNNYKVVTLKGKDMKGRDLEIKGKAKVLKTLHRLMTAVLQSL